jgi:translation initiation factor 4E
MGGGKKKNRSNKKKSPSSSSSTQAASPTNAQPTTAVPPPAPSSSSSQQDITALMEMANKPLHNKWVMWFDNPKYLKKDQEWLDNVKKTGAFNTPGTFWSLFNNLKPATKLSVGGNYHLFKEGIQPMWEDPSNKQGGKWVFTIQKKDPKARRTDQWWLFTCLALIGEAIDPTGDQVCGAVVSIRKAQDRIALWIKTDEEDAASHLGARWKIALDIQHKVKYQTHRDAEKSGHSFRNEIVYEV